MVIVEGQSEAEAVETEPYAPAEAAKQSARAQSAADAPLRSVGDDRQPRDGLDSQGQVQRQLLE